LAGPAAEKFRQTLVDLNNEQARSKTFSDALAKAQATTDKALKKLTRTFTAAAIVLGEKFAPFIVKAAGFLQELVMWFVKADKSTIKLTAGTLAVTTALAGMLTVISTGLLLFVKVRVALLALGLPLDLIKAKAASAWAAFFLPVTTGIIVLGSLLAVLFKVIERQREIENDAVKANQKRALSLKLSERLLAANKKLLSAQALGDKEGAKKLVIRIKQLKAAEAELRDTGKITAKSFGGPSEEKAKERTVENVSEELAAQEKAAQAKVQAQQIAANSAAEKEAARAAQVKLDMAKSTNELLVAELAGATAEEIAILKEKNELEASEAEAMLIKNDELRAAELERVSLQKQLLSEKELEASIAKEQIRQEAAFRQFDFEKEFNDILGEQRLLFNEKELEDLQKLLLTEEQIKKQFADKDLREQIKRRNQFQKDTLAHGKAIATINKFLASEQLKEVSNLARSLEGLSRSKNETLKGIAKAAAITNIAIDTAQGSIAAFTGMIGAFGPVIGTPLGVVAAAAVVANGAIAIGAVKGAERGGVVRGTTGDTNPFMLAKGELITPQPQADTFKAVIAREQTRLEAQEGEDFDDEIAGGRTGEVTEVVIRMEDGADEVITAQQRQSRVLDTDAA